jgi:hypothetical protein
MLECVYRIATKRNAFEVNIEDPSPGMQMLRDCCDVQRALAAGLFPHYGSHGVSNASAGSYSSNPVVLDLEFLAGNDNGPMGHLISNTPTGKSRGANSSPLLPNNNSPQTYSSEQTSPSTSATTLPSAEVSAQLVPGRAGPGGCCGIWTPQQLEEARASLCITKLQCERIMECICFAQIDHHSDESMKEYRLRVKRRFMTSHKDQLSQLDLVQRKQELQRLFDHEIQIYSIIHRKLRIK